MDGNQSPTFVIGHLYSNGGDAGVAGYMTIYVLGPSLEERSCGNYMFMLTCGYVKLSIDMVDV
jgi:hypothetical protein